MISTAFGDEVTWRDIQVCVNSGGGITEKSSVLSERFILRFLINIQRRSELSSADLRIVRR